MTHKLRDSAMCAVVRTTAASRAKSPPPTTLQLVVDNVSAPRGTDRPLPWAACFAVWAVLGLGGWIAIALLLHWI